MGGSISTALAITFACFILLLLHFLWKVLNCCYLKPMEAYKKLRSHGFSGPTPSFPFGNRAEMLQDEVTTDQVKYSSHNVDVNHHDAHSRCMPYFVEWQKAHGKVFVYWIGTAPFVYVADPEFLKQMSEAVATRDWGKPPVFTGDRQSLFGKFGLNMLQGDEWVRHKRVIGPALSSSWLKLIMNTIVERTKNLSHQWASRIASCSKIEIDVETEISYLLVEVTAKINFGLDSQQGNLIYTKLRAMQFLLFKNMFKRYLGVPFGQLLCAKETLEAIKLGNELDDVFQSIVSARRKVIECDTPKDLLGLMVAIEHNSTKSFTDQEVIDECKTFFTGVAEPTKLAISWTLLLLAMNKRWQDELREEINEVVGDEEIDFAMLAQLRKMEWVMNEVQRLYPSTPNAIRHATSDIKVGETTIPQGTNIWVDILGMHYDRNLWGDSVHEFRPDRFSGDDNSHGGCHHKMGYLPFGFGGRMCPGKSYSVILYKTLLSLLLHRFFFSVSPSYCHSPFYCFTTRPAKGMNLIIESTQG